MDMIDPLFKPISIGSLSVDNRIFMPAMHMNMCRNYLITDQLIDFYRVRAEGGAGLISVGYATVDELSGNAGNIGAHDDKFIPGLADLAKAIREGGARAAVQLNHAGRYNYAFLLGGKKPIAPSPIPSRMTRETPREMEPEDIKAVIGRFADAALRVKEAGFDMVEVLAGTGYLISEFLSPLTNKREDQYGGSLGNRMRFGIEVVAAIRARLGDDFPLMARINGNDFMPDGIGRQELQTFAVALVEAGVDALCINVGWHEAQVPQIVTKVPRGVFAYMARAIKSLVSVPVIASHRINDPQTARRLLREGYSDMVAMGRALIADPMLPKKAQAGQEKTILHCVACGQGCFDNLFKMKPVECLCNPKAGHEAETLVEPALQAKKVMVVGGGPAGMSAALSAAEKGHQVTLYEKEMQLGGQLHLAGAPPGRGEFRVLAEDLGRQLAHAGVTVILNAEVDHEKLKTERPDSLILATGGYPVMPPIPGVQLEHVVQAWDILSGRRYAGERVVVIGGGAVGVEVSLFLAEQGTLSGEELKFLLVNGAESAEELYLLATTGSKKITLVEMIDKLGNNFGKSTRWGMLQDVERFGIATRLEANVIEITSDAVKIKKNGRIETLEADTVVLAVGTKAYNPLQKMAAVLGIHCQVVGDADHPATAFEATHSGFRAGRGIA
jgi:2,4-dienoyl-CoA reductase (NADPH2)